MTGKPLGDQEVGMWLWKSVFAQADQFSLGELAHRGPRLPPSGFMFTSDSAAQRLGSSGQQLF